MAETPAAGPEAQSAPLSTESINTITARGSAGIAHTLTLSAGVVAWLALAWFMGMHRRQRSIRADEPSMAISPIPSPGFLLLLAALAVWMCMPLFAGATAAMMGGSASRAGPSVGAPGALGGPGGPVGAGGMLDIRDRAIIQLAGYVGAFGALLVFSLMLPGLWRLIGASARGLPHRARLPGSVIMGLLWSALTIPVVEVAGQVLVWCADWFAQWRGGELPPRTAHETLQQLVELNDSRDGWWYATVLVVVVGAPVIEEIIYRGLLQTGLMHLTRSLWTSVLVTSCIFTFVHVGAVSAYALPALFILSVGLGLAMERTGRLWTSMIIHAAFNLYNVFEATR